jgi:hypothetical protein
MIEIGPARESDVVLAFLKAEIDYSDSREWIQRSLQVLQESGVSRRELIEEADLDNDYHNDLRARLLEYRGYRRRLGLFIGFPTNVDWQRVELESADIARLTYIANEPSWDSYSQRTRSPQVVADRMVRRELPDSFAQKVAAIQDKLKGNETLPELVAVEGEGDKLILIEGAHRITAYVGLNWQVNIPAIIGRSALMPNWHWYAYRP